ncbi:MAG: hypothetical protein HY264_07780 [Chloroflexi bacterium]|nr:hypothetical protein [Chloroflexota bacterium]
MAHERLRFPTPTPPAGRALPGALRDPLRTVMLAAAVVTVVGAAFPFLRIWKPGEGWTDVTGFQGSGDGGFVLEMALVAAVLVWLDGAWTSRIVPLVAGPAILGATAVVILRDFYQTASLMLAGLGNSGGRGNFEPGFWVAVAGAASLAVAGAIETWRVRGRLSFRLGASATSFAGVAGAGIGAILGFMAGSTITPLLIHDFEGRTSFVLVVVAVALASLGAWLGARVATAAARGFGRR